MGWKMTVAQYLQNHQKEANSYDVTLLDGERVPAACLHKCMLKDKSSNKYHGYPPEVHNYMPTFKLCTLIPVPIISSVQYVISP